MLRSRIGSLGYEFLIALEAEPLEEIRTRDINKQNGLLLCLGTQFRGITHIMSMGLHMEVQLGKVTHDECRL